MAPPANRAVNSAASSTVTRRAGANVRAGLAVTAQARALTAQRAVTSRTSP